MYIGHVVPVVIAHALVPVAKEEVEEDGIALVPGIELAQLAHVEGMYICI